MGSKLIKFLDNGFKAKDDVTLSSFSNILKESILVQLSQLRSKFSLSYVHILTNILFTSSYIRKLSHKVIIFYKFMSWLAHFSSYFHYSYAIYHTS